MTYKISSGVYSNEIDLTAGTQPVSTSIGAAVFASQRGPIGPTLITRGTTQFDTLFGNANSAWAFGHYNCRAFLEESQALWVRRVVNNALHAGTTYFNDPTDTQRTITSDFSTGSLEDFEGYNKEFTVVAFNGPLVTANDVELTLWDNVAAAVTNLSVTFNTNSNTTMQDVATAIQATMDLYGTGGTVKVVDEWNGPDRREVVSIIFDSEITNSDNTFALDVEILGTAVTVSAVPYNTNNDTTLTDIATDISAITGVSASVRSVAGTTGSDNREIIVTADAAGPSGLIIDNFTRVGTSPPEMSTSVETAGAGVYDDRIISIVPPAGMTLTVSNEAVTSGATQADVTVTTTSTILNIMAENPGEWGDDIGIKIANIDKGVNQRIRLSTNNVLLTGGNFTCVIKDSVSNATLNIGPVAFSVDSDTTLQLIATAIETAINAQWTGQQTGSVTVTTISSTSNNQSRSILIVAPNSEVELSFVSPAYEGTSDNALFSATETLVRLPTDKSFELQVFTRDNIISPVERWNVTLYDYVNGLGDQMFVEDVVNESASRSSYIRVSTGVLASSMAMYTEDETINWLASGDDGILPTTSEINKGWDDFTDPEAITVRLGINCGYADVAVHQNMDAIAQSRKDMVSILDVPSASQETSKAYSFRMDEQNINSSYSALYTPDLKIVDSNTNRNLFIPPSGHVASAYAYTDRVRREWFAPAGLQRGILSEVIGLRHTYKEGDRDILEPAQINPIRAMRGQGYVIWGAETLQSRATVLSNVSVRRLNITIAVATTDALHYYNWEPNDDDTRFAVEQLITDFMNPIKSGRGVTSFQVVSDETNNTNDTINGDELIIDLYYVPTKPAKHVKLNMIMGRDGINFNELIAAGGGNAITG